MIHYVHGMHFDAVEQARDFVCRMNEIIQHYGYLTVADYYELNEWTTCYNDHNYGWVEIEDVAIVDKVDNTGFVVVMPPAMSLDGVRKRFECKTVSESVNHPDHYQSESGIECIDAIAAATEELKGIEAVDTGQVIKYIWRWKKKANPVEDLEKARWYLDHLIDIVTKSKEE